MRLADEAAAAALAAQFLTRVPIPDPGYSPARMALSPRYYPLVGIGIGAVAGLAFWLTGLVLPPILAALLTLATTVVLTGALHEDGFADLCDGLGGGRSRERALEIMRDSRIGSFGAIGLGLMTATRVVALSAVEPADALAALVAAHGVSRGAMVATLATAPYARSDGAATVVAASPATLLVAAGFSGLALVPLGAAGFATGLAALVAWFVLRAILLRRLGGYTGDGLGATQQVTEAAALLALVAWL